ncbi:MAG: hypothetical protein II155_03295 [Clostridia bacterium]|nr:hypothetical protein [Clostridia bacterium]
MKKIVFKSSMCFLLFICFVFGTRGQAASVYSAGLDAENGSRTEAPTGEINVYLTYHHETSHGTVYEIVVEFYSNIYISTVRIPSLKIKSTTGNTVYLVTSGYKSGISDYHGTLTCSNYFFPPSGITTFKAVTSGGEMLFYTGDSLPVWFNQNVSLQ